MKQLNFENTEEFERVFKNTDIEITDAIVSGIVEAFDKKVKTSDIFEITFDDAELAFEISLTSTQWELALESCLSFYTKAEESDKAIETYLLQKNIRKWLS
jgi:hypothetical protein